MSTVTKKRKRTAREVKRFSIVATEAYARRLFMDQDKWQQLGTTWKRRVSIDISVVIEGPQCDSNLPPVFTPRIEVVDFDISDLPTDMANDFKPCRTLKGAMRQLYEAFKTLMAHFDLTPDIDEYDPRPELEAAP